MENKVIKKNNILYYIAIFLIFVIGNNNISSIMNFNQTFRQIMYLCIVLLIFIKIINDKHKLKEFIWMGLVGIIFLYTSIKVDNIFFIINYILIISLPNVNINKIVKIDAIVKIIYLVVNSSIYYIDHLTQKIPFEERSALYFLNPNATMGIIFWLVIDFIILYRNDYKKALKVSTVGFIPIIIGYKITGSRTALYLYIILYILIFLTYIFKNKNMKIIKRISIYIIDILFIVSLLICLFYPILNLEQFNSALSGRLYKSYWAYNKFGFNVFANVTLDEVTDNVILDNFYTRSIICYGVIIYLILSIWIKKFGKKNDNKILDIIVIVFSIFLFSESYPYIIARCIVTLLIGEKILFNKEKQNKQIE